MFSDAPAGDEKAKSRSVGRARPALAQPFANGTISAGPPKVFFKISLVQTSGSAGGGEPAQYAAYIRFAACSSRVRVRVRVRVGIG